MLPGGLLPGGAARGSVPAWVAVQPQPPGADVASHVRQPPIASESIGRSRAKASAGPMPSCSMSMPVAWLTSARPQRQVGGLPGNGPAFDGPPPRRAGTRLAAVPRHPPGQHLAADFGTPQTVAEWNPRPARSPHSTERDLSAGCGATSPIRRRPNLRHAAVSLSLNSGVPATEVARRAGHSIAVLLQI